MDKEQIVAGEQDMNQEEGEFEYVDPSASDPVEEALSELELERAKRVDALFEEEQQAEQESVELDAAGLPVEVIELADVGRGMLGAYGPDDEIYIDSDDLENVALLASEAAALRASVAQYEEELTVLRQELAGYRQAEMSEMERLKSERAEIEQRSNKEIEKYRKKAFDTELRRVSTMYGVKEDLLARLLQTEPVDPDGSNIEPLTTTLIRRYPHIVGRTRDTAARQTPRQIGARDTGRSAGILTLEDTKRMSTDEINQNWDRIRELLAQQ